MTYSHTVHHYGPDPRYVGGMGSVIRVLAEQQVGSDSVVTHATWRPISKLVSALLALRAALGIPRLKKGDIAHVHLAEYGAFVREGALAILARRLGKTTVVTIHGAEFLEFAHRYRRSAATVLRHAHLITCLDEDVLRAVRRLAPTVPAELMPNPVVIDGNSGAADETDEIVLFGGEIGLRKGADVLCRAWQLVSESRRQAHCIVVGPATDFVVPQADRLEVRSSIASDEMRELLRSARVVVLPSRAEGMPMILTEAMSGGRPFVSTPVGGIPELASHGGLLVPVGDEIALARCLTSLLEDRALARAIGERGRQFCIETRSVEVIDARLKALYAAASCA
jgi:glycosyltransferase involved in cell wall biosynthesis